MWEQINEIFRRAALRFSEDLANFLPGLLVLVVILLLTIVLALLVRIVLVRVLRGLEFDRRAEQLGLTGLADPARSGGWSVLAGRLVMWIIIFGGLLAGLSALDATMPTEFAVSVFRYLPDVFAALLILIVGTLVARFLARSVLIGAVNLQLQSARLLSVAVKWLVLILAWTMALDHLRIGGQILLVGFGILFGGIVLAAALAVGLGSKDVVGRSLERRLERSEERSDKLPHV